MNRTIVSALTLSLALSCIAPTVAHAEESKDSVSKSRVIITSESGSSTLSGDTLDTSIDGRTTQVTVKSSGKKTVTENPKEQKAKVSRTKVSMDDRSTIIDTKESLVSSADLADDLDGTGGDAKAIRDLLRSKESAKTEAGISGVASVLQKKSEAKLEAERIKKEKERLARLERERQERLERERALAKEREEKLAKTRQEALEALQMDEDDLEVSLDDSDDSDRESDTDGLVALNAPVREDTNSFNLRMGDSIDGDNTTRTGGPETIVDGKYKDPRGLRIAKEAVKHIGKSYVWGGESPTDGWDCSGFVQWLYAKEDVAIPRVAIDQARFGVKVKNPIPGDLVLQNNGSHIGIYLGDGKMISAWSPDRGTIIHEVSVLEYDFYAIVAE